MKQSYTLKSNIDIFLEIIHIKTSICEILHYLCTLIHQTIWEIEYQLN